MGAALLPGGIGSRMHGGGAPFVTHRRWGGPPLKIKSRYLVAVGAAVCAVALSSCSVVDTDDTAQPSDTMTFCALLGARMMTMVTTTADHTPDPARLAEDDQKMQAAADRISSNEADHSDLGQTTSQFIAATNPTDAAAAHTPLQSYCNAHGLSPFPQQG